MPHTTDVSSSAPWPDLGSGIGLRTAHYSDFLNGHPDVAWLEALTENYLATGGRPKHVLLRLSERYPIVLHGVSLSIGGTSPIDYDYLARLKELAAQVRARWISDHLCWTGYGSYNLHELLPMPLTEESLDHVVERLGRVQDFLGQAILLENPSSYASFAADTIGEAQFLREVALRSGCGILLDVNNVYVSAFNHDLSAREYIDTIPAERVGQYHVAGHTRKGTYLLDSHIGPVPKAVWELYRYAIERIGPRSTLLEWDDEIPELSVVLAELEKARLAPRPRVRRVESAPEARA